MFTNCEGCTVLEASIGTDRKKIWIPHLYQPVYWEQKNGQTMNKNAHLSNMGQSHEIYVAIPMKAISDYIPKHGDLIFRGKSEQPDRKQCYTIMNVVDCRYGSKAVQHIEVEAI